jgi:hypothetical protein
MSYKATDYTFDTVKMPDTANGSNSRSFSVPRGAKTAVFFVPDLTGAGTCSLQVLQPQGGDQDAETWVALSAVVYAAGATIGAMVMAGFADSTAYVVPVQGLGGATIRFVSTVAQGATVDAFTIFVVWGFDAP